MSKRGKWVRASLGALLCIAVAAPVAYANTEHGKVHKHRQVDVQLLGVNDFHGQLDVTRKVDGKEVGRADYLAAYLHEREKQNPNTLLVHSGDMVGASPPVSALMQDEPTIEFLNTVGFDVGTLGNHEFDEGYKEMLRLIKGGHHDATGDFAGANFPYIAANVVKEKNGKPLLRRHVVKRIKGVPVAFIGVVTKDAPKVVTPAGVKGVKFLDEAKSINREVKKLKRRGIHSFVVLAHEGGFQDEKTGEINGRISEIAKSVNDDVDVIMAGHSHSNLNTTIDNKLIVQANCYGTSFSDVDLTLDRRTRDIVKKKAEVVNTYHEGVTPDPEVAALIKKYQDKVEPIVNKEIGQSADEFTRTANASGESQLGNLVSDAQRWKMQTDIALMNPGGIRSDMPKGKVTWGDLYTIQPFNNELITMKFTGKQLKQLLNQQWAGDHASAPKILQISGFTYQYDPSRPAEDRVTDLKKADGTPITEDQTLTATANAFLAGGGDGFTVFNEATDKVMGPVDLDALIEYIKQLPQPFSAKIDGRIQKVGN
ncbi:bifunctional metallophosphatase/5'-nucleotidase [Marininema halotolerans]|uniref:5'-nucleotidase n=1 Tax=Marininema halotolerans TaxID=1155944 RepID=A0A1I6SJ33_9BACL|nr:5'-nucleotidase C-terminal domain-containing protein [Marininema halotolerans]SFS76956.1 5'-nucleotidase [Marininema halotolerans]